MFVKLRQGHLIPEFKASLGDRDVTSLFWRDVGRRVHHSLFHIENYIVLRSVGVLGDRWGPGYPHTRDWQPKQWCAWSNRRRGDTAETVVVGSVFQWLERRQDTPVAGVTCYEHFLPWAVVVSRLASYKLDLFCILICIHAKVYPNQHFFLIHFLSCHFPLT